MHVQSAGRRMAYCERPTKILRIIRFQEMPVTKETCQISTQTVRTIVSSMGSSMPTTTGTASRRLCSLTTSVHRQGWFCTSRMVLQDPSNGRFHAVKPPNEVHSHSFRCADWHEIALQMVIVAVPLFQPLRSSFIVVFTSRRSKIPFQKTAKWKEPLPGTSAVSREVLWYCMYMNKRERSRKLGIKHFSRRESCEAILKFLLSIFPAKHQDRGPKLVGQVFLFLTWRKWAVVGFT